MECRQDCNCLQRRHLSGSAPVFSLVLGLLLAGCGTVRPPIATAPGSVSPPPAGTVAPAPRVSILPPAGSGRGGYYLDDGPGDAPPPHLEAVPDAEPKIEPYAARGNKPYVVFGKTYVPLTDNQPLKQRGTGSWYGKKFHGQKTSSGERYDMYKMTAAHPTLPIPSYARVTNLRTGAQVIVRVNDRGPFHSKRIIDLSYTAALKLGYIANGSAELEVERILPDEIARMNSGVRPVAVAAAMPVAVTAAMPVPLAAVSPTPLPSPLSSPVPGATGPAMPSAALSGTAPPASQIAAASLDDFLKTQETPGIIRVGMEAGAPPPMSTPAAAEAGMMRNGGATTVTGGYYLQFGAYAQNANAEGVRQQLLQRWPAALPAPEVRQNGALYRLYSGPFGNRGDAVQAAAVLSAELSGSTMSKPVIVQP